MNLVYLAYTSSGGHAMPAWLAWAMGLGFPLFAVFIFGRVIYILFLRNRGGLKIARQLREGNAESAKGTVVTNDYRLPRGSRVTNVALRQTYTVRVEPDSEEPFEARIAFVRNDPHSSAVKKMGTGQTVWVLYDPDDHSKVAFDIERMWAEMHQQGAVVHGGKLIIGGVPVDPSALVGRVNPPEPGSEIDKLKTLADLRDRGAITEPEFEAEKAKLLGG
jgi:hypothetical protein